MPELVACVSRCSRAGKWVWVVTPENVFDFAGALTEGAVLAKALLVAWGVRDWETD